MSSDAGEGIAVVGCAAGLLLIGTFLVGVVLPNMKSEARGAVKNAGYEQAEIIGPWLGCLKNRFGYSWSTEDGTMRGHVCVGALMKPAVTVDRDFTHAP